ncbi:MAG: preprotein translocase subunit SecG [Pseudomonadota bacterium]
METVVLVIHLIVCLALVGLVLLQKSEGGALGIGGPSGMASGRRPADPLTRTTTILAIIFFSTSLALTLMSRTSTTGGGSSIIDGAQQTPGSAPAAPAGSGGILDDLGGLPDVPSVPQSQ